MITVAGGTGEASPYIRKRVFQNLGEFGIFLDGARNDACIKRESQISGDASKTPVWVVPTNEEIVIARSAPSCWRNERIERFRRGLSYRHHAKDAQCSLPEYPVVFF